LISVGRSPSGTYQLMWDWFAMRKVNDTTTIIITIITTIAIISTIIIIVITSIIMVSLWPPSL
jgi:hypothetical protein